MENSQFTREEQVLNEPQATTMEEANIAKDLLLTVLHANKITLDCGIKVMAALIIDCFPTGEDALFKGFLEAMAGAWKDKENTLQAQRDETLKEQASDHLKAQEAGT